MIEQLYDFAKKWTEKGTIWLYSDPHFSDEEQIYLCPNKPTDEEQVKRINSKVGKHDTLILLGDIGNKEFVKQLRGYKVLICGNHDAGKSNYKRKISNRILCEYNCAKKIALEKAKEKYKNVVDVYEEYDVSNAPFHYWKYTTDNKLFDEVYEGPVAISEKIILSHEPMDIDCMFNIHGHTHGLKANTSGHYCVCSDFINYTPVNLKDIINTGKLNEITTLHRKTIDTASERKIKK